MNEKHRRTRFITLLLGLAALLLADFARADPPTRVVRLGYTSGAVSFSPSGEEDWLLATLNQPLLIGDRLWTDVSARTELQNGSATIRMSGTTLVSLLNLDDHIAQLQLTQGTLNLRVRRFSANDVIEIDTPNLAYSIRQPGEYRVDVDPVGNSTTVIARYGLAEVSSQEQIYSINAGQAYRFFGSDLRNNEHLDFPPADEFDYWSSERNRREDESVSARYLAPGVIGYEDLDEHGTWSYNEHFGNVWVPNVPADWSPYSDGHWAWIDPWGWTWVDDESWGFAVTHYGRWVHHRGRWCWVPGPAREHAVYAPAMVAFVGGDVGGIAWFPLGPNEVYRPAYPVSRNYFTNINKSNTVVNNINITNVYNNTTVTNVVYANRQVPGAVVAVSTTAFAQSQRVSGAAIRISKTALTHAPVTSVAAVAPTHSSVSGAAPQGHNPPRQMQERPFVARNAPPAAPPSFAAKEHLLATKHGKPLDAAELQTLKHDTAAPAMRTQLMPPTQPAAPLNKPPFQRGQPPEPAGRPHANTPAAPPSEQPGKPQQARPAEQQHNTRPVTPPSTPAVAPPAQRGQSFEPAARPQAGAPFEQSRQPQQARPAEQQHNTRPVTPPSTPAVAPPAQRGQSFEPAARPQAGAPFEQPKQPQQARPAEQQHNSRPVTPPSTPAVAPPAQREQQRGQPQQGSDARQAPPNARPNAVEKKPDAKEADRAAKAKAEKQKAEEEKKKSEGH